MLVAIPAFIESGIGFSYYAHKASAVMGILQVCDVYFFIYAFTLYQTIQKLVTSIVYNVEENKFVFKQLSSWTLTEREFKFSPEDLVKHYRKSLNPFIGYKSRRPEDGDLKFATESTGEWNDRQLLDSMIYQSIQIKKDLP